MPTPTQTGIQDNNPTQTAADNAAYVQANPNVFGTPANTGTGGTAGGASSATPASIGLSAPVVDPNVEKARLASSGGYLDANGNPTSAPDYNTVYQNTVNSFQSEIDALNKAAADARQRIAQDFAPVAANRVGGNTAIQARRGLLGSDFGQAQTDTVNKANATELSNKQAASDAEYNNRVSALYSQARTLAQDQYNQKNQAYQGGAKSTLEWLTTGKPALQQQQATDYAKKAFAIGADLTTPEHLADVKSAAQALGMAPEALIEAYKTVKQQADAQKAANDKALAEYQKILADTNKVNKEAGAILSPEQVKAKADAEIKKLAADTNQSYASAAASLASAEKSKAETAKIQNETQAQNSPLTTATQKNQIGLITTSIKKANELANRSGSDTTWEHFKEGLLGSTGFTELQSYTDTIKSNLLTIATDPNIKKFFGPQMSDADVRMMTASATNLNPKLQSPEAFKTELKRVSDFVDQYNAAVAAKTEGSTFNGITLPN